MATHRHAPSADGAAAATGWAVLWWAAIAAGMWFIGSLFGHPWAGLFMGLIFGFFARDYVEGKSLWTLLGFVCWIAGVAVHHPWVGFFTGVALTVAIGALVYQ